MVKYTKDETDRLRKFIEDGLGPKEISNMMPNRSYYSIKSKLSGLNLKVQPILKEEKLNALEDSLLGAIKKVNIDVLTLADQFDVGPKTIRDTLYSLHNKGYNIQVKEGEVPTVELYKELTPPKPLVIPVKDFFGGEIKFGAISDTHLGSKYERMDVLNALYDIFEKEGIKKVFHGGNFVDGEFYFNKYETYTKGFDDMIDNFIKKYPQRKGLETHFIAGDDHEGWWMQREGLDAGRITEERARQEGRDDLIYLGYQERDLILKAPKGEAIMRIMHAGGGTAYADSYSTQKIVESFQEGEKPHILLVGHYHKQVYHTPRGIHVLQLGTTQDQTRFMRKRKLRAHLGGYIVRINQAPTGEINRFQPEWFQFWGKDFYKNKVKK
ncbi:MAG: metallophosphoesterase family protein [Bacteroidetes bacterium]|nr:metallophosphoesterase family protein [Bacteroidota bacterium]